MKFRAYCIVVIGDTLGVIDEVKKICESEPSHIDGKGLYIATFISAFSPSEIKETFTINKRNFLVFELDSKTSGVNLMNPDFHEGLFGFLKRFNREELDNMSVLFNDINMTSETSTNKSDWKAPVSTVRKTIKPKPKKITEEEIIKMSSKQKQLMLDEMIDNGLENLSEEDKKILELLAK